MLVYVIDVSSSSGRDPLDDYRTLRRELSRYQGDDSGSDQRALHEKASVLAANKIDLPGDSTHIERLARQVEADGVRVFPISAVTGQGVSVLLEGLWKIIADARHPSSAVGAVSDTA